MAISLNSIADFNWAWNHEFFVECAGENFIWSSPSYGGDNTMSWTPMTIDEFLKDRDIPHVRCKGKHLVREYCGENVVFT